MAQQAHTSGNSVTGSYRTGIDGAWWAALVVVTVLLGFLGRSDSGFWSAFLWSIVGFVVGSLVAIAVAGRLVSARSEDEVFAHLGGATASGSGGMR